MTKETLVELTCALETVVKCVYILGWNSMFTCVRNAVQLGYHPSQKQCPLAFDPDNWNGIEKYLCRSALELCLYTKLGEQT